MQSEIKNSIVWLHGKNEWNKRNLNPESPVILIHSISGNAEQDYKNIILCWQDREDTKNIPLLCINSPSLTNPGFFEKSIKNFATVYLQLIEETLGHYKGPILFIGYSAGGIIAHEMAKQCQQEEPFRPASVYYIDTTCTTYYQSLNQADFAREIYGLIQYLMHMMNIHSTIPAISPIELARHAKDKQLGISWRYLMEHVSDRSEEDRKKYLGMYICMQSQIMAQMKYKPTPVKNAGMLAFDKTIMEKNADTRLGWPSDLPMIIHLAEGDHLSLTEDAVMPHMMKFIHQTKLI